MSERNWENFLTGKDGVDIDQQDEENESPMSTLKLSGSNCASIENISVMAADSKPKVETLEEKIARVMAGINMPKLDSQKSLIVDVGAGSKTPPDRSMNSEISQYIPQILSSESLPGEAKDSSSMNGYEKDRANIMKPLSSSSQPSFCGTDGDGVLKVDDNTPGEEDVVLPPSALPTYVPTAAAMPAQPMHDSDSEASSVRRGAGMVKLSNTASDSGLPLSSGSSTIARIKSSHSALAEGDVTFSARSSPPPELTATIPVAKSEWSEEGDTAAGINGGGRIASLGRPNVMENSPVAQAPLSYNPAEPASPTSQITDTNSPSERGRSQSSSCTELSVTGNFRNSARSTIPAAAVTPPRAEPPGQLVSKPSSVSASTVSSARPKCAPRPSADSVKTPAVTALTPKQQRIPDKGSALSTVALAVDTASTLDTPQRRSSARDSKEVWSVTKRAQLDSSYATPGAGRALVAIGSSQGQPVEAEHSVSVAVRIRPFTIGEIQRGPRRVVSVNGDKLILVNPHAFDADPDTIAAAAAAVSLENMRCNDWAKVFCFDNCFWSYDPNDEGDAYVDQDDVFDALGSNMAEDIVNGISTCCFAYGHTSTGKTHTMFGGDGIAQSGSFVESEGPQGPVLSADAGLIPRVFLDVVQRVFNDKDISTDTHVTLSFMEIYQEKIRDCLAVSSTSNDLKVREHPALGPYVENLTRVEVESASDVLEMLYRGYEERSTASTLKNKHSSRSHAIATLELSQMDSCDPFSPISKPTRSHGGVSSIPGVTVVRKKTHVRAQMVDLAGSEKERSRELESETPHRGGVGGSGQESNIERLELKTIRRSLSTLGYIIKALGQGNSAKGLPFRDSTLTWLLKDALSGNCNVTMLATISPAHTCFDETLHTLKYADRLCRLSVSSLPGKEATGRVGINDTVDPNLTYSLATEYSKLKQELGANKPGTHAARHLLQQTISDPQQRLARLDPYKSTDVGEISLKSTLSSSQRSSGPASTGRSRSSASGKNDFFSSGALELVDQDLKEAYRQLHGKYVELQIELENARTDRDGMQLELQNMQDSLSRAESERFMGSRSAVSDMTIALRSAEEEVSELRGVVMRKEEAADRLLSELADERQARGTVEKTARAQVTELIVRLEALHKQGQATAKESQKRQQEASIIQQEKAMVESQVLTLKEELLDAQESAETRISQLEDELRLSMDHVTNAVKERERTNSEITSVLKEKADMAAREVLLTQRIQELQMEVEKANNESKVKSELDIVKLQRDSLFEIIKQQEQALNMQQQQSEASLKMLHQRQAALDRYEQRSEGEHDELSDLQKNLQSLLANEGQMLYSELIDARKLIAVVASVREKVAETGLLKEDIARLEDEREAQRNRLQYMEKEHATWREERAEVMEELDRIKKLALDWETRAQYWQQVSKKASSSAHSHPADSQESGFAEFAASAVTRSTAYLDLRSENTALLEKLSRTQDQLSAREAELKSAQEDVKGEFSQLWASVEQLNKLDSAKTKTIAELTTQRDAAVKEKNEFMRKYCAMEQEYEGLQSELQSIDLNLLDVADHEGIEVEDILHVVHDNHPHVPHDISDSYFAKRFRSRSPTGNGRRHADTNLSYSGRRHHTSMSLSIPNSGAMTESGNYRNTGPSTGGETPHRGKRDRDRLSQHDRSAERTPSSSMRRSLAESESNDEKGLEMQIEELSQFLTHDSSRKLSQRSRLRMTSSRSKS